jgi:hypothetical protein
VSAFRDAVVRGLATPIFFAADAIFRSKANHDQYYERRRKLRRS